LTGWAKGAYGFSREISDTENFFARRLTPGDRNGASPSVVERRRSCAGYGNDSQATPSLSASRFAMSPNYGLVSAHNSADFGDHVMLVGDFLGFRPFVSDRESMKQVGLREVVI
jgi:hypothetical protein